MSDFDILFPEGRRFDDRQLRIEDDGRDFEFFVCESLSLLVDPNTLCPGFGRGRDGAIDHMVEGTGCRTVIECKFIGRHATNTPQDRWGEVRRHLNDNLPKLAAKDPPDRRRSPYAPWLDPERPIGGYLFCVSFAFSHAAERNALEQLIAADFLKLSQQSQLSHLENIQIKVRGWDDFYGELRRRFSLRYRWFGDLPRGVVPLREKRFESRSFRRFLFEESLPFFSREKYLAESSGQQITREEQLVSNLSAEQGDEALILGGAGGVGKTRLGLELCDRLSKIGWLALRLTDNATSASVADLVKAHAEPAQTILLSDYAERADDLSAIVEEISLINDGNAHRVRLIATCRMSAFSSVQDALAPLAPREVTLGTPRVSEPSEIAFTEWVVRQILAFGRIPESEQIARVCHGLPILAAFALFLHERNSAQFSEQFGDLTGIRDFRDWVKRRLDIALRGPHFGYDEREVLRHLGLLSLRLPMTRREADDLADRSSLDASLLEMMRTDRWIEDDPDRVTATHDVFADAMVGHYVFQTRAVASTRLAELLRCAAEQDFLARALLAIDRLASHPDFDAVDGTTIVRDLIARAPTVLIAAHERLLRGRLLSDRGKIEVLAEYPDMHAAVSLNRDCDVSVSHIADTLARLRRNDPSTNTNFVESAADVMAPLLAASLANPHPGNMLLRRAFALLPETYRSAVLTRIATEPVASQTHFLLVACLYAGLLTDEIASATDLWLSANAARNLKASFVIRAWLEAGGNRELIDPQVLAWINAFGAMEHAQFVYRAWLGAGGNRELIDPQVLTWINAFGAMEHAKFVYRAWLEAGGNRELIDPQVLAWINAFGAMEHAGFVYPAWLGAGGNRELIDPQVLAWINAFGAMEHAGFVYRAWLEAGGNRELIDPQVLAWINAFGAMEHAQFVYRAWLEAGGQRQLIDPQVLAWINAFGAMEHAGFVYPAWLGAGGNRELIDPQVLAWINAFGAMEHAGFVYRAWLGAGGNRELIDDYVLKWFEVHGRAEAAKYVYNAWLAAGGDFEKISRSCLAWFSGHAATIEAGFVLKYIARQTGLPLDVLHAAIRWCALFPASEDAIWRAVALLRTYVHSERSSRYRASISFLS